MHLSAIWRELMRSMVKTGINPSQIYTGHSVSSCPITSLCATCTWILRERKMLSQRLAYRAFATNPPDTRILDSRAVLDEEIFQIPTEKGAGVEITVKHFRRLA